jgi:AAA domain
VAEPVVKAIGDSVWVIWKNANGTEPRAVLEFARVAEHRDSLSAEVSVHNGANTELHWARVNLVSTQARNALAKAVEEREPMDDWRTIIDRSCRLVAKHVRTGEPAVPLVAEPPRVEQWMVNGLIIRDQLNVLFGDGGTGKSYMALALGLSGLLRRPLSARWRMAPLKRVLYLDWESGRHEQAARLWCLTEGFQSAAIDGALMHRTMRHCGDPRGGLAPRGRLRCRRLAGAGLRPRTRDRGRDCTRAPGPAQPRRHGPDHRPRQPPVGQLEGPGPAFRQRLRPQPGAQYDRGSTFRPRHSGRWELRAEPLPPQGERWP